MENKPLSVPALMPSLPTATGAAPDPQTDAQPKAVHKRAKQVAALLAKWIDKNPTVIVEIEGKRFPCIEAWQFVAACYQHTPMISATQELQGESSTELGFIAIAHLANGQGRIVSAAESACMRSESDWTGKPSFQLRSMAQTRACGKVCRNLFAYVMVMAGLCPTPAEEMPGSHQTGTRSPMTGKRCSKCHNQVSDQKYAQTIKKHSKALCVLCEREEITEKAAPLLQAVNDPQAIPQAVQQMQERKGPQPIIGLLDNLKEKPYAL